VIDIKRVLDAGLKSPAHVGVGLPKTTVDSVKKGLESEGGTVKISGYDDPRLLVLALKNGTIDAAVRGTMSSAKILEELKHQFSIPEVMRTAVLEDTKGRRFLLTPIGIDEGMNAESRTRLVLATQAYFAAAGWRVDVAVMSKGRFEDRGRSKEVDLSLDAGEKLCQRLRKDGMKAEHYAILIEDAVSKADLIVAPDGVCGNLIFRSMHYLGGGKAYGAPVVNLRKVFVDTSRGKTDFTDSILLAAGLVSVKAGLQKRS